MQTRRERLTTAERNEDGRFVTLASTVNKILSNELPAAVPTVAEGYMSGVDDAFRLLLASGINGRQASLIASLAYAAHQLGKVHQECR